MAIPILSACAVWQSRLASRCGQRSARSHRAAARQVGQRWARARALMAARQAPMRTDCGRQEDVAAGHSVSTRHQGDLFHVIAELRNSRQCEFTSGKFRSTRAPGMSVPVDWLPGDGIRAPRCDDLRRNASAPVLCTNFSPASNVHTQVCAWASSSSIVRGNIRHGNIMILFSQSCRERTSTQVEEWRTSSETLWVCMRPDRCSGRTCIEIHVISMALVCLLPLRHS